MVEKVGAAGVFGPGFDSTNASTTTDTKGRYTFTALPAGTYTVTITACTAGPYLARTITGVQVIGGQITTQNATLASA